MARRESDNEPDLLTGMWVVEGPVPGIPREFVGGVIDFDTETSSSVQSGGGFTCQRRSRSKAAIWPDVNETPFEAREVGSTESIQSRNPSSTSSGGKLIPPSR